MIRRMPVGPEDAASHWILISQVDHAHFAGQLAEHWGAAAVAPLVARNDLLWAITHHDDGWSEWERTADVEPESGRPRSFTEMPLDEGLAIWMRSINAAAEHGALAGFVVAGHFCALLRRFDAAWKGAAATTQWAERFLATFDKVRNDCLQSWLADSVEHTPKLAERALGQLQLFDALSLWFCCQERPEPEDFPTPSGSVVRFAVADPLVSNERQRVEIWPWPLCVDGLNLEIAGREVPQRRYQDRSDLAAVPSQRVQLRWRLEAAGAKS
jgi:hypothetical protein